MHIVDCGFQPLTDARAAASLVVRWIPGRVFWPYFVGAVLLAIGLPIVITKELPHARGLDRIVAFGRLCFAIPMAVFGTEHFTFARFVVAMVPSWIPAHRFWVDLVGVALIAAALCIIVKRQSRLAALLLGIMLVLFVVLMHIPRVLANPRDRFAWAVALRDIAFSGGAFAFAGAPGDPRSANRVAGLVTLGRCFVAIPAVFFAVEQFLHPEFVPGVPLDRLVPIWVPGRLFWSFLSGAVLLLAGVCLLIKKKMRGAATYLGVTILLLVLAVYLPILADEPSAIGTGLNYFVDTLAFGGAALVLAGALPKEDDSHV